MKTRLLALLCLLTSGIWAQGTLTTSPPLTPNNGQSGITFSVRSNIPTEITGMSNIFSTGADSADIWIRVGGAQNPPNITTANGWQQVISGAVLSGANNTSLITIPFSGTKISIPANTPVGIHIAGNTRYQTGTSSDQVIYSDNTFTVDVSDSVAHGGGAPSPGFNPRRFLGSVTYALGVTGNCPPFSAFTIDSISATAAKVNWTSGTGNTSFDLEYGPAGFTPGTGTTVSGTLPGSQPPVIITGLTANTNYDVYLSEYCNSGSDTVRFPTPQGFSTTKLCARPTNFASANLTSNTVDLTWNQAGSFNESYIMYGPGGFTPGGANSNQDTVLSPNTSYTLSGLSPSTSYDIYLVTNCGTVNGYSDTVGPISINTPLQGPVGLNCTVGSPGAVFYDDLEVLGGWTGDINSGAGSWNYNTGGTSSGSTGPSGAHSGQQYVYVETSGMSGGNDAEFISPAIDLTTSFNSAELSFWLHAYGSGIDTMQVQVANNVNGSYQTIFTNVGQLQSGNSDPWTNVGVNLDNYVGQTIYLKFRYVHGSGFTGDVAIDLIEVTSCQTCPNPSAIQLMALGSDSASFSWTGSGNKYDVTWGPTGFSQGSAGANLDSTFTNSYTVDSLLGNTGYEFYVRNNCTDSSNGFSGWVGPYPFTTLCNPFTAPYRNNFDNDSVGLPPDCWSNYLVGSNTQFSAASVYQFGTPRSSPNHIRFYNYNNDTTWLITPQFSDLDSGDRRILFYAQTTTTLTTGNDLVIGTLSSPDNHASFSPVDTISLTNNYQLHYVDFTAANGYNGTDQFIAFNHAGSTFRTFYIDDFEYVQIPLCQPPFSNTVGVSGRTANSATVFWGASAGDSTFVEWGTPGFTPGTGTSLGRTGVSNTTSNYTITGLTAQTTYEFYIQDTCFGVAASPYVGPFSFTTACLPFAAPYREDFDGSTWTVTNSNTGNIFDPCWSADPDASQGNIAFKWVPRSNAPSSGNGPTADLTGGNYMYAEASGSRNGDTAVLYSPLVDISTLARPALYFGQHRFNNTASIADMDVDITTDGGATWNRVYNIVGSTQSGASDPWDTAFVDLSAYAGNVDLQVRFTQISNGCCGDAAIDLVEIKEGPTCPDLRNLSASNVIDTAATLRWDSSGTASQYQVWVGSTGFYQGSTTVGGGKGFSTNTSFVVDTLSPNTCYDFLVRSACGPGDTSAWVGPFTFCTTCPIFTAPYVQDFENATVGHWDGEEDCWDFYSNDPGTTSSGGYSWEIRNTAQTTSGTGTGPDRDNTLAPAIGGNFVTADVSGSSTAIPDSTVLTSPIVDISSLSSPELEYYYHRHGTGMADMYVDIYDGTRWVYGVHSFTNTTGVNTSQSDPYIDTIIDLSPYSGISNFQVRFRLITNGCCSGDVAIDDIRISDPITCPAPSAATASNATATTVDLSWTAGGSGTSWEVEVGPAGFTQGTGTRSIATTNSNFQVSGLTGSTVYDAYVREICGPADTSFWSGPSTFATACITVVAPFYEDFENHTVGHYDGTDLCWDFISNDPGTSSSGGYSWEVRNTAQTTSSGTGPDRDNTLAPAVGGNFVTADVSGSGGSDSTILLSPVLDISQLSSPEARYYYHRYGSNMAELYVDVFNGTSWDRGVHAFTSLAGVNNSPSDPYKDTAVDLSAYSGTTNLQLRFRLVTNGCCAGDVAIDDFSVDNVGGGGCVPPSNVTATNNVGCDSVEIDWNSSNGGSMIEYGPAGFTPGAGTLTGIVSSPYTVSGLNAGTAYDFYVADTCGTDTSAFVGPAAVTTASGPLPVASFTVDSGVVGNQYEVYVNATASTNADSYQWIFDNGDSGTAAMDTTVYSANGGYTITLIVTNACGSDTATFVQQVGSIGLLDNPLSLQLELFPNPTEEIFTVRFSQVEGDFVDIEITDAQGRKVRSFHSDLKGSQFERRISVADLARGIYGVKIQVGDFTAYRRLSKK